METAPSIAQISPEGPRLGLRVGLLLKLLWVYLLAWGMFVVVSAFLPDAGG
jgi:hypothetical protein